jgi:prophage antirepressor-like protein
MSLFDFYGQFFLKNMNELVKSGDFTHELFGSLTTIKNENNDVFFISNEVSKILEYSENRKMLERLDDDEVIKFTHEEAVRLLPTDDINSRGIQLLTESGLYSAILGSRKPEAKVFKKWVTSEVLPAIRKTGSYSIQSNQKPLNPIELIIQSAQQLLMIQQEQEKQAERIAILEAKQISETSEFYTIAGYCALRGLKKTTQECNILGRKATKMSKELDYTIGSQYSAAYGRVNTYHLDILTQIVN